MQEDKEAIFDSVDTLKKCLGVFVPMVETMKPIKENNPNINIVAIDYDAGATAVNQENRIKLMLANSSD
jgi:argininosuccinate lyase